MVVSLDFTPRFPSGRNFSAGRQHKSLLAPDAGLDPKAHLRQPVRIFRQGPLSLGSIRTARLALAERNGDISVSAASMAAGNPGR